MSRAQWSRFFRSAAFRVFVVLAILYTVYHCVAANSDRVITDVVVMGSEHTTLEGEAVLFRDETVLYAPERSLLLSYPNADGAKVNGATPLVELYSARVMGDELRRTQATLLSLDRQIALAMTLPIKDTLAVLHPLQQSADTQLLDHIRAVTAHAALSELQSGTTALQLTLQRISALTGEGTDMSTLLSALRIERQTLLAAGGYALRTVSATDFDPESTGGYFYYADTVDGLEHLFSRSALASMTVLEYETLMERAASERQSPAVGGSMTVLGKLVQSYKWSIVLPVSLSASDALAIGEGYTVTFHHDNTQSVSMTLDRIISSIADGQALLVLSAATAPAHFDYIRYSEVELTVNTIEGYRIPETALTTRDGVDGVYILEGGRVSFRAVEILTRGQGYVLAYAPNAAERSDETDSTYHYDRYLDIRDILITEGDALYDGKYID